MSIKNADNVGKTLHTLWEDLDAANGSIEYSYTNVDQKIRETIKE